MLPFLNPNRISATLIAKRKPDGGLESKGQDGDMDAGIMSAAEDLIRAVHSKDARSVAKALKSAFEMCDTDEKPESEE